MNVYLFFSVNQVLLLSMPGMNTVKKVDIDGEKGAQISTLA